VRGAVRGASSDFLGWAGDGVEAGAWRGSGMVIVWNTGTGTPFSRAGR
jgi:hypothetical protein